MAQTGNISSAISRMVINVPTPAEIRQAAARRQENLAREMVAAQLESGFVFPVRAPVVLPPAPEVTRPRRVQPEALRLANERRRAVAIAKREYNGLSVARTAKGRFSNARLTPEARAAVRRSNLNNARFVRPLAGLISLDVSEPRAPRTRIVKTVSPTRFPGVSES